MRWRRPSLLGTAGLATALALVPAGAAHAAKAVPSLSPGVTAARAGSYVLAWGGNTYGQLGNGTKTDSNVPVFVALPITNKYTVVRCLLSSYAVTTSGKLFAWGNNDVGQLGDGTTSNRLTPVRVKLPTGVQVTAVRAGGSFALALTSTGKLLAWGDNTVGELGNGSGTSRHRPVWVKLPKGAKIASISAGSGSALAVTTTGRLLSWGWNASGQLGTGNTKTRRVPGYVKLPARTSIKSIASSSVSSFAVTAAGGVLAWGLNGYGQLGDGTTKQRDTPVRVKLPAGTKAVAVAAGLQHTLAMTASGRLLAWGLNVYGQLGNDTTTNEPTPVRVKLLSGTKVTAVVAGKYYSMALTAGHQVLTWGDNDLGELGNGGTAASDVPVSAELPPSFSAYAIGAGFGSSSALVIGHQPPV